MYLYIYSNVMIIYETNPYYVDIIARVEVTNDKVLDHFKTLYLRWTYVSQSIQSSPNVNETAYTIHFASKITIEKVKTSTIKREVSRDSKNFKKRVPTNHFLGQRTLAN